MTSHPLPDAVQAAQAANADITADPQSPQWRDGIAAQVASEMASPTGNLKPSVEVAVGDLGAPGAKEQLAAGITSVLGSDPRYG